jgi:hypothetical protein
MMKDNIDDILAVEYARYNCKPFNIDRMLDDEVKQLRLHKEYIMTILNLNRYIVERTKINITETEFSDMLHEWLISNKSLNFTSFDFYIMKVEILFFCGNYAFFEILQKEDLGYGKDLIKKYEHKQKFEEGQLEKMIKILDDFETKKVSLIAENKKDELFQLHKEYHKIIINNSGVSILIYIFARRMVREIFFRTSISKKQICELICEIFDMFEFIPKNKKINFIDNFYRQLNRIDKEKEERLLKITTGIVKFLSP